MELTFLVSSDGTNAKRCQTRRACNACRHRKKRCYHNEPQEKLSTLTGLSSSPVFSGCRTPSRALRREPVLRSRSASPRGDMSSGSCLQSITGDEIDSLNASVQDSATETREESRRFACDSNPMATLIEKNDSRLQKGKSQQGDVGAWICPDEYSVEKEHPRLSLPTVKAPGQHPNHVYSDRMPPKESQAALLDIYFRQIHPILPFLDESLVRGQFETGTQPICLARAICLVAAKDQGAASFLYIGRHAELLSVEKFSTAVYNDLMQEIPRRSQRNVLIIQVLALLSLHEWGSTGSEDCSLNLAQAIHHAHSMGLHLKRPDQHSHQSSRALFWCLWSLDRWNAAMHGRPLMIHDGDTNQRAKDCFSSDQSAFRLWLRMAEQLGEVIHYYRPMMKDGEEGELDLPSFEELVTQCEAWDLAPEQLESLHLVYHSVIVLSTYSKGLQGRLRPRMSEIRQDHSILTIASLICNHDIRNLLPMPMIGYTISLAFSVTYKQLRASRLPSTRHTGLSNLCTLHKSLQNLSTTWWLALVMAHLGQRVLNSIQPSITQRSTDHEVDISRSTSQPTSHHPSTHPLDPSASLHSQSSEFGEPSEWSEPRSECPHPLDNRPLRSAHFSYSNEVASDSSLSTVLEDFDSFFGNFPDLNFPSSSNDQLLLDLDIADFEFFTTGSIGLA